MTTLDRATLDVMLADLPEAERQRRLATLGRIAKRAMGQMCPECGATSGLEDNGAAGSELVYLCTSCGHQWGPGTET